MKKPAKKQEVWTEKKPKAKSAPKKKTITVIIPPGADLNKVYEKIKHKNTAQSEISEGSIIDFIDSETTFSDLLNGMSIENVKDSNKVVDILNQLSKKKQVVISGNLRLIPLVHNHMNDEKIKNNGKVKLSKIGE